MSLLNVTLRAEDGRELPVQLDSRWPFNALVQMIVRDRRATGVRCGWTVFRREGKGAREVGRVGADGMIALDPAFLRQRSDVQEPGGSDTA